MIRINSDQFTKLSIILLVISLGITPNLSYSATIDPPLKQMVNGANSEDVICKSDFTLMIRNSGGAACVKPTTAEKLTNANWGIIEKESTPKSKPITALINYRTIDESRQMME